MSYTGFFCFVELSKPHHIDRNRPIGSIILIMDPQFLCSKICRCTLFISNLADRTIISRSVSKGEMVCGSSQIVSFPSSSRFGFYPRSVGYPCVKFVVQAISYISRHSKSFHVRQCSESQTISQKFQHSVWSSLHCFRLVNALALEEIGWSLR